MKNKGSELNSITRLHLISDSTGETLRSFSRASLYHFDIKENLVEKVWSLVRSSANLDQVLAQISEQPGIILYTLADKELGDKIKAFAKKCDMPCYGLLEHSVKFFATALNQRPNRRLSLNNYHHNEESLSRLAAMEYALTHDDGQAISGYKHADVVIVGVSRTSKTPTCIYLANRGIRAANFPLVPRATFPPELTDLKDVLVVGLTLSTRHLLDMRRTRLDQLGEKQVNAYADYDNIRLEITEARRVYSEHNWHVIDVTYRSVEETSALIIQKLEEFNQLKNEIDSNQL